MPPIAASLLLSLAGMGCLLHSVAAWRLRRHLGKRFPAVATPSPVTFWRALKPGIPDLEEKLECLIRSTSAGDQILLGVDVGSSDLAICQNWKQRHADRNIAVVECEPARAANPKISKFLQMQPHALHRHWILTDSESLLTPEFVAQLRAQWAAHSEQVLTAGYRFTGARRAWEFLDTLPAALTLWPGLMLVPRLDFTLGACTALRADQLAKIGGWPSIADRLAEDHSLGQRLAASGAPIALASAVLSLEADPMNGAGYARHQHRSAVTYRVANPAGALGLPIFQCTPLALLAWSLHSPFCLAALMLIVIRTAIGAMNARALGQAFRWHWLFLTPVLEFLFWFVAWLPLPVWWAGRWCRVSWRGTFVTVDR